MINSEPENLDLAAKNDAVHRIVASGAHGAIALAGISTAIVIAIWFAFYFFVFLPRGPVP
jgi:hypothetical protein